MPFLLFPAASLVATVPKSLAFAALGYFAGAAYGEISTGIYWLSPVVIAALAVACLMRHRLVAWCER